MNLSAQNIKKFQTIVWNYYITSGRDELPWRHAISPYKIWVSEIMLQQTQVNRVVPFFRAWMKSFPTVHKLANASQTNVLQHWKGLGYNSRALRIKQTAGIITKDYHGKFPTNYQELKKLPGIGPYTAGAISIFANNQPEIIIETNIRRVYIHHFFQGRESVSDYEILEIIQKTIPDENYRQWYWALMDYGSFLGRTLNIKGKKYNPNTQSKHYIKQKKFIGSNRQIRGKILEILLQEKNNSISIIKLKKEIQELTVDNERVQKILNQLQEENFIIMQSNKIGLKK